MNKKDYYWAKYMLIFGFFCISFGTSIFLKTEHAPDEAMRMLIPEYIVSHHTLPNGMEESVRHPLWGFSYALYPYLTAIISSVFMAITSLFTKSAAALLTAARLTSVLSGTGTLIVVFLIGEELFERRESARELYVFVVHRILYLPRTRIGTAWRYFRRFPAAVRVPLLLCKQRLVRRFHGRTDHLFLDSRHEKRILQKRLYRPGSRLRTLRAVVL